MAKLGEVNYRSRKLMQAIAALCPRLTEISFVGRDVEEDDIISVQEFQSILQRFKVFFNCLNVLDYFGNLF